MTFDDRSHAVQVAAASRLRVPISSMAIGAGRLLAFFGADGTAELDLAQTWPSLRCEAAT